MIGPDMIYCTSNTTVDYWDPDPSLVECLGNSVHFNSHLFQINKVKLQLQ